MFQEKVKNPEEKSSDPSVVFFKGTVQRITYQNKENGFGVIRAEPEEGSDPGKTITTIVGTFPPTIACGVSFIARGRWHEHPKFGRQFKAFSVTEKELTSEEAVVRYLGSGAIKGLGPVLAQRVVDKLGVDALKIIDKNPDCLKEVSGIGEIKFLELKASWQQKKNLREVMLFFQGYSISLSLSQRIYSVYGDRAIEKVKENPYRLSKDVWGIGFHTADNIARALGIQNDSPKRITAGLEYALKKAIDQGHCFLPRDELISNSIKLLEVSDHELYDSALREAIGFGELIEEHGEIFLPNLYNAETQLSYLIKKKLDDKITPNILISDALINSQLNKTVVSGIESMEVSKLSDKQKDAVKLAANKKLLVITGGPGCGKTTVLKSIASMYKHAGLSIKLAAPTGRAAQRLAEVCGMQASTIHRLLKFDPMKRSFVHNTDNQLEADAIIIDESSMIDLPLAASLFSAIKSNTRVVIVGDADQLPSVGPGLFLKDVLSVEEVPRVFLTTLFRRALESSITNIAHQINSGNIPKIPEPDGMVRSDAYFLKASTLNDAAELVERLVVEQIPKKFGFKGQDITVLTPMNQGDLGTLTLNTRLQNKLIPAHQGLPVVKVGELELRLGDRICQRVNNYNLHANGVYNGDQGEIIGIDAENKSVIVKLWDGREITYSSDILYQLDLAYALTIHRSQGSEVPVVVLALHDSHNILLEKQLIYTAVTRAKKLLIVVGTKKALAISCKRNRSRNRYTRLSNRISNLLTKEEAGRTLTSLN